MKRILLSTLVLLFTTLIGSCQRIKLPAPALSKLFGKWKYIESSGGFTGKGADWPANNKIVIEFNKNGKYSRTENGKIVQTDKYNFTQQKSIFSGEMAYLINYNQNIDQSFKISGDTLLLSDEVNDGFNYTFKRLK